MTCIKLLVTTIFLALLTNESFGQKDYYIGDIVPRDQKIELLRTNKSIGKPYAQFIEKSFTIIVSKVDVIKVIDETTALFTHGEEDRIDMMNMIKGYLDTCSNLNFKHLWTAKRHSDGFAWSDYKTVDIRRVAEQFLLEGICSIIEKGQVRVISNKEEQENYYYKGTNTKYGIVNGVFTEDNRLIWMCPPIIVE